MSRVLTIIGASVRAAAHSAVRAGYDIRAADLFADADLCRTCQATRVSDYPGGLSAVVRRQPSGAWMYTGALENHPGLVESLARVRPLWGNNAAVLRRVRDPGLVAAALGRSKLQCPAVACDPRAVPRDGSWLRKPLRSAGGARIEYVIRSSQDVDRTPPDYFQQFVDGPAFSAVYVAAGRSATLLGITRQLIGQRWTGASGFRYCGSVGPIELPTAAADAFHRIGIVLASEFQLVGLFGVDAIVNAAGVWPVEVNPRYTGSVEVLERAEAESAISVHAAACQNDELPVRARRADKSVSGKAILFARQRLRISADWSTAAVAANRGSRPTLADIPVGGSVIEEGWPIATVLADAADEQAVVDALRRRASEVFETCQARSRFVR